MPGFDISNSASNTETPVDLAFLTFMVRWRLGAGCAMNEGALPIAGLKAAAGTAFVRSNSVKSSAFVDFKVCTCFAFNCDNSSASDILPNVFGRIAVEPV